MKTYNIAINKKFDQKIKKQIEESLGTANISTKVKYYYSVCEDANYTMIFLRGKDDSNADYIRILTHVFKIKGIYMITNNYGVGIHFYNKGEDIAGMILLPPDELSLEANNKVTITKELLNLKKFNKDLDVEKFIDIAKGKGKYFFFPRTTVKLLLSELNLECLSPMLYWEYDNLSAFMKIKNEKKKLIDLYEFTNLEEVKIEPSY